jgi:hypothetical protein
MLIILRANFRQWLQQQARRAVYGIVCQVYGGKPIPSIERAP